MATTVLAALVGCCRQSIGRKSIFNLAGVAQVVAGNTSKSRIPSIIQSFHPPNLSLLCSGISYLLGMILYPAGWGADRVQRICGPEADAFYLADCSLGKTPFLVIFSNEVKQNRIIKSK